MMVMVYGDDERRIGSAISSASPQAGEVHSHVPCRTSRRSRSRTYNDMFPPPGRLATVAAVERVLI
jgi:hypothetical protein